MSSKVRFNPLTGDVSIDTTRVITTDTNGNVNIDGELAANDNASFDSDVSVQGTTTHTGQVRMVGSQVIRWPDNGGAYIHSNTNDEFRIVWNPNGAWWMEFQSDRNVVIYSNDSALWAAGTQLSDRNQKDNISPFVGGLDVVQKLNVVNFEWKKDCELYDDGKTHTGFIAQDVKKIIPDAVKEIKDTHLVQKEELIPFLVKAIQEQQEQIDELKAVINKK